MKQRYQSFEARAARRNRAIAARNQKRRDANPLFDQAGIIEQVAALDQRQWDALALAYDDIGRGVEHYERALAREAENQARYATYRHMLCLAIGEENVEEVEADDCNVPLRLKPRGFALALRDVASRIRAVRLRYNSPAGNVSRSDYIC